MHFSNLLNLELILPRPSLAKRTSLVYLSYPKTFFTDTNIIQLDRVLIRRCN